MAQALMLDMHDTDKGDPEYPTACELQKLTDGARGVPLTAERKLQLAREGRSVGAGAPCALEHFPWQLDLMNAALPKLSRYGA